MVEAGVEEEHIIQAMDKTAAGMDILVQPQQTLIAVVVVVAALRIQVALV
jgi:hypothetical protein